MEIYGIEGLIVSGFQIGDTGGPFVDNNRRLFGLISWGYGCARPHFPRVLTSVSQYREWIEALISG